MSIHIRKMDLSDVPYVYQQETKIFGKSLGEKTLYNEIIYNDMSRYFIALLDGKRAGYVGSWLTIPNAEIINLFVEEKYRRQGIGKKLVRTIMKVCKEESIENITLEVRPSNFEAQMLYSTLGFRVVTKRKNYYSDGEDAYVMMYTIGVRT